MISTHLFRHCYGILLGNPIQPKSHASLVRVDLRKDAQNHERLAQLVCRPLRFRASGHEGGNFVAVPIAPSWKNLDTSSLQQG